MSDSRLQSLTRWVSSLFPAEPHAIAPASADASFRRYFRVTFADRRYIVMDAPPEHEDCRPFIAVARLFGAAGAHVPAVLAENLDEGFLLLADLGATTYLQALQDTDPDPLYRAAAEALVAIQRASREGILPDYDAALLLREMRLFPEWYVARHRGATLSAGEHAALEDVFRQLLANNLAQPRVFVHRDYHARNLMFTDPNPGILDFQDAVYGPITYDMVSLLKDAYVAWEEERLLDWLARYWEAARRAGLPVNADFALFHRDFEWMGVQRHLKVLGIFARLWHRDGKAGYLADMPRVMAYLRAASQRYRELHPLRRLLDRLDEVDVKAEYTF